MNFSITITYIIGSLQYLLYQYLLENFLPI